MELVGSLTPHNCGISDSAWDSPPREESLSFFGFNFGRDFESFQADLFGHVLAFDFGTILPKIQVFICCGNGCFSETSGL